MPACVGVDGDKEVRVVDIGNGRTLLERDEDIAVPGQDGSNIGGAQQAAESLCNIEIDSLFRQPSRTDRSRVLPSVPGVEDDRSNRLGSASVGSLTPDGDILQGTLRGKASTVNIDGQPVGVRPGEYLEIMQAFDVHYNADYAWLVLGEANAPEEPIIHRQGLLRQGRTQLSGTQVHVDAIGIPDAPLRILHGSAKVDHDTRVRPIGPMSDPLDDGLAGEGRHKRPALLRGLRRR